MKFKTNFFIVILLVLSLLILSVHKFSIVVQDKKSFSTIKQYIVKANHGTYKASDVKVYRYGSSQNLYLTLSGQDPAWWGLLQLVFYKDKQVKCVKDFGDILESGITKLNFIHLKGFNQPIIEVYASSHMGNGSIFLYTIKDNEPKLILRSWAVDNNWEQLENPPEGKEKLFKKVKLGPNIRISGVIHGGNLLAKYKDVNHDGIDDVILKGKYEYYIEDIKKENFKKLVASEEIKYTFIYDKKAKCFKYIKKFNPNGGDL